ncbi:MAG: GDSL-type esterase/lipase family protein [Candidatus Nanohaloarchaea archaeon]|nr:GDSL-type esterase/lipase family protein [Candidatus Nanohaloarchaea archaeon]
MARLRDVGINILLVVSALAATFLMLEGFFRVYLGSNLDYTYDNNSWYLKPSQTGFTTPDPRSEATINRFGFRGDYNTSEPAVVVLGDSLTFGYCLPDNETLPYRLEQRLEERYGCSVEVVNAGVPGYGVQQMIELYDRRFSGYPGRYVVLSIIRPDILRQKEDNPYTARKRIARRLIRRSSFLAFMKPRLDILRQFVTGKQQLMDARFDQYLPQDKQRIARFARRLEQQNKTLILHVWAHRPNRSAFYDEMARFAAQEDITIIGNHYPTIMAEYGGDRSALLCSDGHPSGTYTDLIAGELDSFFRQRLRPHCTS